MKKQFFLLFSIPLFFLSTLRGDEAVPADVAQSEEDLKKEDVPKLDDEEDLPQHIFRSMSWIDELDNNGNALIFLPGEREIKDAYDMLSGKVWFKSEILQLFGRLSVGDQQRIFQETGKRKIILATNVAETSITIPGVKYVIDSGLAKVNRYDPRLRIQSLQTEFISKASVKQRRGRCAFRAHVEV